MRINLTKSSCWHLIVYTISGVALVGVLGLVVLAFLGDPAAADFGAEAAAAVDLVLHRYSQYNSVV